MRIIMGIISLFLNGCGPFKQAPDTDVTSSPQYNFSTFAGTLWKTKVKVALVDCEQYTGRHAKLIVPPDCFDPAHPKFISNPNFRMIRVLPVGTCLRIERLMKDNGNWGGVRIIGSIEDRGVVYEDAQVEIERGLLARNRFTFPDSDSNEWAGDPDMLEKVAEKGAP